MPSAASETTYLSARTARRPGGPSWSAANLADILPLIPAPEKPDILVCSSPEYLPIPQDLPSFRGLKVLLITDWNVCLRFLPDSAGSSTSASWTGRDTASCAGPGIQRLPPAPVRP